MTVILMLVTTFPTGEDNECQRHLKISPVSPDSGAMKQLMFLKSQFQQFPFGALFIREIWWSPLGTARSCNGLLQILFTDLRTTLKLLSVQLQVEGKTLIRNTGEALEFHLC